MVKTKQVTGWVGAVLLVTTGFSGVNAATVSFDGGPNGPQTPYIEAGYSFDYARIVGGPCDAGDCAALNQGETSVLTQVGGGTFDFTSIWFYLNGKGGGNLLSIFDTNDTTHRYDLTQADYNTNTGYDIGLDFLNVASITFLSGGDKGNARFDSLGLTPSAVPLPAGGLLLMGALAGLAALRRRKV